MSDISKVSRYLAIGGLIMALSVVLGAFGAHALGDLLSDRYREVYKTAHLYHAIHGLGLLLVILILHHTASHSHIRRVFLLFCGGILLFSGSLYLMCFFQAAQIQGYLWIGAITPLGGLLLIGAWVYTGWLIIKGS